MSHPPETGSINYPNNFCRLHSQSVGRWRSEITAIILEKLLWEHRRTRVGRRLRRSNANGSLSWRAEHSFAWRKTRWCDTFSIGEQARSARSSVSSRNQRCEFCYLSQLFMQIYWIFLSLDSRIGQHHNTSLVGCWRQCCHGW